MRAAACYRPRGHGSMSPARIAYGVSSGRSRIPSSGLAVWFRERCAARTPLLAAVPSPAESPDAGAEPAPDRDPAGWP
ncbi:hypothetical protein ACWGIU_05885 [Streptomyces sp. NPDC054840]